MLISGINILIDYKILDKHILLLGEIHTNTNLCQSGSQSQNRSQSIEIHDFISDIILSNPTKTQIDIFFEGIYGIYGMNMAKKCKNIKDAKSGLCASRVDIPYRFYSNECRIHFIDPRSIIILSDNKIIKYPIVEPFNKFTNEIMFLNTEQMKLIDKILDKFNISNVIDFISESKHLKHLEHEHEDPLLLMINYINESNDNDIIYIKTENYETYIYNLKKIIRKSLTKLNFDIDIFFDTLKESYNIYSKKTGDGNFVLLMMLPMDIYTLIRLFYKFNLSKTDDYDRLNREEQLEYLDYDEIYMPNKIKNVIIYAGISHIELYNIFLNLLSKKNSDVIFKNTDVSNLCLDISDYSFF
jgi:hypothetical protein